MINDSQLWENALAYAYSKRIRLRAEWKLGHGSDGAVWRTSRRSAIKAVSLPESYARELECYQRLRARGIQCLGGFHVPELLDSDDQLRVIEMSIVQPPFLLDFGKVYLDQEPPYWSDTRLREEILIEWRERFDERWEDVAGVLELLKSFGIAYVDPRPGNISFEDKTGAG